MTAVLDSNRQVFFVGVTPPTGDYNYLDNKPAIDGVTLYSDTTKEDLGLDIVFKYKGQVNTYEDLPTTGNEIGDTWNVKDTGENYCWNGSSWDCLSGATTVYYNNNILQSSGSNISINVDNNNITNIETDNLKSGVLQTTIRSTEQATDISIPSEKAVRTQLNTKVDSNNNITGATHTKITYDSKGLVTNGSDITLADVTDVTATASEVNVLDGIIATTTELNYTDGVTSNIQIQLNGKQPTLPTYESGKFLTNNGTDLSWSNVEALPSQSGMSGKYLTTNGTTASWAAISGVLPSQEGQSGKYLTTNGTTASWATVDSLPSQSGNSGKFLTTNGTTASWASVLDNLTFTSTDFRTVTTIPSTITFSKANPTVYYTAGTNTSLTFSTFSCSDSDLANGTYTWELICSSSNAITGTTYGNTIQYVGNDKTYNPSLAFALIDNTRTAHSFAVRMIKNGSTTLWMFCYNYSFKG